MSSLPRPNQPYLICHLSFVRTTNSPDILFDPFALGFIPEPETPKPTHDCTHNRVRKYPSIPASHPPITYIYVTVPYRTVPHHHPPMPNFISFSRLHDNPWVSKKKKHTKLSPTREPACHCGLDRGSIRCKHSFQSLIFGRLVHVVQPALPLSGEHSSHQVEV